MTEIAHNASIKVVDWSPRDMAPRIQLVGRIAALLVADQSTPLTNPAGPMGEGGEFTYFTACIKKLSACNPGHIAAIPLRQHSGPIRVFLENLPPDASNMPSDPTDSRAKELQNLRNACLEQDRAAAAIALSRYTDSLAKAVMDADALSESSPATPFTRRDIEFTFDEHAARTW